MRDSARNNKKMVAIIDYDAGNIKSVEKAFQFLGKDVCVTRNPKEIINKLGNKIKLVNIPNNKVIETKPPKATVPPKSDNVNTENPNNNTKDV